MGWQSDEGPTRPRPFSGFRDPGKPQPPSHPPPASLRQKSSFFPLRRAPAPDVTTAPWRAAASKGHNLWRERASKKEGNEEEDGVEKNVKVREGEEMPEGEFVDDEEPLGQPLEEEMLEEEEVEAPPEDYLAPGEEEEWEDVDQAQEQWRPEKAVVEDDDSELGDFNQTFIPEPDNVDDEDHEEIKILRRELDITVESEAGANCMPILNFNDLDMLPKYLEEALEEWKFDQCMPIQAQALPMILAGHDVIGIAQTGSGKTMAYLIPGVLHAEAAPEAPKKRCYPSALVVAPTRELAMQICEEAKKLVFRSTSRPPHGSPNHPKGVWASCVYGGQNKQEQLWELKGGCHILAATPGRLKDLVESNDISLKRVTYFVLDEADRMLDYGFAPEVTEIAGYLRPDRQTLFFSATWPEGVQELAASLCGRQHGHWRGPARISVGQTDEGAAQARADIKQVVEVFEQESWEERDYAKQKRLYGHLRQVLRNSGNKVLVFVNSKTFANELSYKLSKEGFPCNAMHGGQKQPYRNKMLDEFRRSDSRLLVATDVMGRGIDIPDVTHVVIYDMGDVEDYIHRIGRTSRGRTGQTGHALALYEYSPKWPRIPGELAKALEDAGQPVPKELRRIVADVNAGRRKVAPNAGPGGNYKRRKKPWDEDGQQEDESGKYWGNSWKSQRTDGYDPGR